MTLANNSGHLSVYELPNLLQFPAEKASNPAQSIPIVPRLGKAIGCSNDYSTYANDWKSMIPIDYFSQSGMKEAPCKNMSRSRNQIYEKC